MSSYSNEEVAAVFSRRFGRPVASLDEHGLMMQEGDIWFCAPDEVVSEQLENRLSSVRRQASAAHASDSQSNRNSSSRSNEDSWLLTLSESGRKHLRDYMQLRQDNVQKLVGSEVEESDLASANMPWIVDLTQNPLVRPRASSKLLTLLTRSVMWSIRRGRPLLGDEALLAQGVDRFGYSMREQEKPASAVFECPYSHLELNEASKAKLAGNAICVPICGQMMAFLSATAWWNSTTPRLKRLSTFFKDEEDEEKVSDVAQLPEPRRHCRRMG